MYKPKGFNYNRDIWDWVELVYKVQWLVSTAKAILPFRFFFTIIKMS
jgi:hypothetical protein